MESIRIVSLNLFFTSVVITFVCIGLMFFSESSAKNKRLKLVLQMLCIVALFANKIAFKMGFLNLNGGAYFLIDLPLLMWHFVLFVPYLMLLICLILQIRKLIVK